MIKLKPLAEQILLEADDEMPTWGQVKQAFEVIVGKQNKADATNSLKTLGKFGLSLIPGVDILTKALEAYDKFSDIKDVGVALFSLGKTVSSSGLKNPNDSKFKQLTSGFWDAVKLDPKVSTILDDKIEKQFLDQVILPKLKTSGNENEPIPNMNYELGKWLNDNGLKTTDIFFKGQEGDL